MAKQVSILQPSDVAALRKAHAALTAFLVANDGPAPRAPKATPALTKSGKPRKPTGAAAHKANLAKAGKAEPKAKPKAYPPVVFDEQQQAVLAELQGAGAPEPVAVTS